MSKLVFCLVICYTIFFNIACTKKANIKKDKINVSVSIPPQAFFVNKIGGSLVSVNVMISKSHNPHSYEPSPKQLIELSQADLFIKVGVPELLFERKHFDKILSANKDINVVNMSSGLTFVHYAHKHDDHESGEYKDDDHKNGEQSRVNKHDEQLEIDPHIWLSPSNVKICSRNIYKALVKVDPKNKDIYKRNLNSFIKEIDALDSYIKKSLEGLGQRSFIVYHSAWGYFARDYGLTQLSIEPAGKKTSIAIRKRIIDTARLKGIKVILVQEGFSKKSAIIIANEVGAKVVELNPLSGDWINNLKRVANTFKKVL